MSWLSLPRIKRLSKPSQYNEYSRFYTESFLARGIKLETKLTAQDLQKYDYIYGIFDNNQMVGGFIINLTPKRLQYFLELGEVQINEKIPSKGVELTAVWKHKETWLRIILWPLIALRIISHKTPYGIVTAAYTEHGMYNTYMKVSPQILVCPTEKGSLSIFKYTKAQFLLTVLIGVFKRIIKALINRIKYGFFK